MIEVWEELDCESVGDAELTEIQRQLQEAFGDGAVDSPAAIARVLADEGAVLRHPEVLVCDVKWRQARIEANAHGFDFSNLEGAAEALLGMAVRWDSAGDEERGKLRTRIKEWSREAELLSRSKIVAEDEKILAEEIRSWIGVWLQNPTIFQDWLSLRKRAPEFVKRFG